MNADATVKELDDWEHVCQLLPSGWQEQARLLGALRRARGFPDASVLLRTLLVHLAGGCSLKEAVTNAQVAGWCDVSAVALFKRLRAAERWLRWMADQLWQRHPTPPLPNGYRARAIDATTVSVPGSVGTDWRLHYGINLESLQCDFFEVTDAHGGETFQRIPVAPGDLLLGDRVYATAPGIAHVAAAGGHVMARVNNKALPLIDLGVKPLWDSAGSGLPSSATARALIEGGWWRSNAAAGRPAWSVGHCGSGPPRSNSGCRGRRYSWQGTSTCGPTCRRTCWTRRPC